MTTAAPVTKFAARSVPSRPLSRWLVSALATTVGSKLLIALTGLGLTVFVIFHMAGNLLLFQGRDALNSYAQFLKDRGMLLWGMRLGLLAIFVIHVVLALRLYRRNRAARSEPYVHEETVQASWASRHMALTGVLLLAFILFHLMHYTFGVAVATAETPTGPVNFLDLKETVRIGPVGDPARGRHDVYAMTVYGFRNVTVSIFYILAQIVLAVHLSHGVSGAMQSLGWTSLRLWPLIRGVSLTIAVAVAVGNISMPIAVMTRLVGNDVP